MGKYAVVVGINYVKDPKAALKGCCNDARMVKKILNTKGFEDEDIKMIIDDDPSATNPSGANVKKALYWLCKDRKKEDVIFFHFSGHGTQVPSDDGDEADRKDEAIVLEGMFLMADDDLKQFFSMLPKGCKATVVMDCCHSGSMLDGVNVAIDGAKDNSSITSKPESLSLLSLLGGVRDLDSVTEARALNVGTLAQILGGKMGRPVSPNGSGIGGALAENFGGDSGKLMVKFALSKLSGGGQSGTAALAALAAAAMLGGGGAMGGSSGKGGMMGTIMKFFKMCMSSNSGSGPQPMSNLGSAAPMSADDPIQQLLAGGDPMGALHGMLGDLGLSGTEPLTEDVPHYALPTASTKDVAILVTGCQAHETSADVRPPGGEPFGALTKTLSDVYFQNQNITNYDLVSQVRKDMSRSRFTQNPCLECSEDKADQVFIC